MHIDELIAKVDAALAAENPYSFLPDIRKSLDQMKENQGASSEKRFHIASGLERLILEDYAFSESELGGALLEFSEAYGKERGV